MNKSNKLFLLITFSISFSASAVKFTDIFREGFYAPLEGTNGAKYFPEHCDDKFNNSTYAVFVGPDRISTPLSNIVCMKKFQIYSLSPDGQYLSVDLQFKAHKRIQAELAFLKQSANKLVYEGIYRGRTFKMTFEKVSEDEIRGYATDNGHEHGAFALRLISNKKIKRLKVAEEVANACAWLAGRFRGLCPNMSSLNF